MSRKLKSMIAVLLSVLMFFTLTVTAFADEQTAGGWEVSTVNGSIPAEVQEGLQEAIAAKGYVGTDWEPVAYIAEQIVAGTKYAVFCKGTPVTGQEEPGFLVVATFTVDAEGKAGNLGEKDFDIADYAIDEPNLLFMTGEVGGWQIPEDYSKIDRSKADEGVLKALTAFDDQQVGVTLEPMACLGKQEVNGTNYAFLCYVKTVTETPEETIQVVTVHVGTDETATATKWCKIVYEPDEQEEQGGAEIGAWTVKAEAVKLPEAVQAAFDDAKDNFIGAEVKPIAYFAKQVVNGVNYGILCTSQVVGQEQKELCLVKINTDKDGKAAGCMASPEYLADFADKEENLLFETAEAGGWAIPEDHTTLEDVIPFDKPERAEEFKKAVEKLEEGLTGVDYEVMNYLGCQIVSGTNYAFLCHVTTVTEEPTNEVAVVTVNVDPEGNITIVNKCTVLSEGTIEPEHTYHFEDVAEDEWYTDAIYAVSDMEIMTGYEGHKLFGTMDNLSRAQFVTVLYRMAGEPEVTTSGSFVDVPADAWYSDAVEWAKAEGIIKGYKGGKYFGPADEITREQLLTMVWRRSGGRIVDYALNFKDVDAVSDWALEAIRWAASLNILTGTEDGYINPQGLTKRCECAAMIYRRINATGNDAN